MSGLNRINPLFAKIAVITLLTLALLVPLSRVESLIAERSALRDSAVERVAHGVGRAQSIGAVMMIVPVTRTWVVDGKVCSDTTRYHVLAAAADITGSVDSELRNSGIYSVPAFRATLRINGSISDESILSALTPEAGVTKKVGTATLFMAISDPNGIRALDGLRVDGALLPVSSATESGLKGVQVELGVLDPGAARHVSFAAELSLSGTERLQFLPWAQTLHVALSSAWPNPSFSGAFAPDSAPQVSAKGFAADWRVLQINRDYPQVWPNDQVADAQVQASAFGVDFYQPVDAYQRDYRAIHYAVLFIVLTFMVLFLWEHTLGTRVHALQYAMIGTALSVFYLVLVAFSEHLPFSGSYFLAAGAMTALLAVYFSGFLRSRWAGLVTGAMAGTCYSLLYLLVLSEEYALLFGALAIFAVLSSIMIGTRRLDWYVVAQSRRSDT